MRQADRKNNSRRLKTSLSRLRSETYRLYNIARDEKLLLRDLKSSSQRGFYGDQSGLTPTDERISGALV